MGGGQPRDNSVQLMAMEQQAAREAREAEERRRQEERADFERRLNTAYSNSMSDAEQYFTQRGLDPNQYTSAITSAAQRAMGNVPHLSDTPGAFFDNLGASVFDQLTQADQSRFMRDINQFAGQDFANRRITNNAADPYLEAILQEQRGDAENYIQNLLGRGVITNSGLSAAMRDLDRQSYGANAQLRDVGMGQLEQGRAGANEIANNARRAVGNYELGMEFDPYRYSEDLDSYFADFFGNLGGQIRGAVPGQLFNTAGLPGIAGAAQGAGNTRFDPAALAGIFQDDELQQQQPRAELSAF